MATNPIKECAVQLQLSMYNLNHHRNKIEALNSIDINSINPYFKTAIEQLLVESQKIVETEQANIYNLKIERENLFK
jgi:hypothetical protein